MKVKVELPYDLGRDSNVPFEAMVVLHHLQKEGVVKVNLDDSPVSQEIRDLLTEMETEGFIATSRFSTYWYVVDIEKCPEV